MELQNPAGVTTEAAQQQTGNAPTADTIASMIAANRASRNQSAPDGASVPPGGQPAQQEPQAASEEHAEPENQTELEEGQQAEQTEEAGEAATEAVDFLAFADENPSLKIRIPNKNAPNGFVELDAKKAAAILGQGSAIHQKAEQLKSQQEQFSQYEQQRRQELDGLQIGLELTVVPHLESLTQEVVQLHQYNTQWKEFLDKATTEEERLEAVAGIKTNEELIKAKSKEIQEKRPKVEQFFKARAEQVGKMLNHAVENYKDKTLKSEVASVREQLSKHWPSYNQAMVPGVANVDLITADEALMSLVRDGLKFRAGPKTVKNAGGSITATSKLVSKGVTTQKSDISELQEKASKGDKGAQHNLLAAMIAANKNRRK